jgi:hypothetical protein
VERKQGQWMQRRTDRMNETQNVTFPHYHKTSDAVISEDWPISNGSRAYKGLSLHWFSPVE